MGNAAISLAAIGVALGLGAGLLAMDARGRAGETAGARTSDDEAGARRLESEVAELRKTIASVQGATRQHDREVGELRRDLGALTARVDTLEQAPRASAKSAVAAGPTQTEAEIEAAKEKQREEMFALQKKVFSGKASAEEQQRFWELARTTGIVGELMKQLEGEVEQNPGDIDLRMNLAQAYVAKLLSIPGGPEQGVWASKAESQWKTVLERDPDHWDARYAIAFSWSMYPEFLNKTPDAIKEFEKVREVQERQTPQAKHAQTYVQLAILYRRQGNTKGAREMLKLGSERHPDDAGIQKALSSMGDE
jgi:tetratricopeptide (TPR) repeat protein